MRRGSRSLWGIVGVAVTTMALVLVAAPAALAAPPTFTKTFAPDTIGPGSTTTLTFAITNGTEPLPATDLAFSDDLPAGVTIATPANPSNGCDGTLSAPDGGSTISLSGGSVGAGATCTITVDVTSSTPGTHTNTTGDLTSSAGTSGPASDDLTVSGSLPGFSKAFAPGTVDLGERSTLTFTIDNAANPAAVADAVFSDTLPTGLAIADPAALSTDCGAFPPNRTISAAPGTSLVSFSYFGSAALPVVAAGGSCTLSVDVVAGAAGTLVNSSDQLLAGVPVVETGKATAALTVTVAGLHLTKEFADDPLAPGASGTLRFTITNFDRLDDANGITFSDDLDAALSGLVAVEPHPADPCGTGSSLSGTSTLTLTGGTLGPEGSCSFEVTVAVPAGAGSGASTNTTGTVSGTVAGSPVTGNAASDDLFVSEAPTLTKAFTDDPVGAGGTVTLRFTLTDITSAGGSSDIAFVDPLPFLPDPLPVTLPATPCGPGSAMSVVAGGIALTGGSLAAGASCVFDVTIDIPAGLAGGPYPNTTGPVSATVGGSTVTGGVASDTLVVIDAPDLSKDFIDDPIAPGDPVTLEFTLRLDADAIGDATGITFTDDLTFVTGLAAAAGELPLAACGGTLTGSAADTLLTFSGGSLTPGEVCEFSVTLQSSASTPQGAHTNTTSAVTATVAGVAVTDPGSFDDLTVADLTLTKSFTDDPVLAGDPVTLEFEITNGSATDDATDVFFTDDLDAALEDLAAAAGELPAAGCGGTLSGSAGDTFLTFSGGSVPANTSCTLSIVLDVPGAAAADSYTNRTDGFSATINGSLVALVDATDDLVVADAPSLALRKSFTNDPVAPGDPVTLRFTISNPSLVPVGSIGFTDDLAATLAGLTATGLPPAGVCGGGTLAASAGGTLLTFSGGSLPPGGVCSFSATLGVPAGAAPGTYPNTTSVVSGDAGGPASGPAATDGLRIRPEPLRIVDLSVAKTGTPDPVVAGESLTYTVTVSNAGPDDADVTVTDTLPPEVTPVATTGCANDPAGAPVCELGAVAAGGSASYTIEVIVDPGFTGTLTNSATATADETESDPSDNSASVDTEVVAEADLAISKADDPDPVEAGGTLTYTVTVENLGPSDAAGVVVTDTLPAGVSLVSTAGCGEDPGGVPTCTLGDIPAGDTASYTIEVAVDDGTSGTVTNTATVSAATTDPNPSNDSATEDTEVLGAPSLADLAVTKDSAHHRVQAGSTLVYTVSVTNLGPDPATGVVVTDTLPAGVTFTNTTGCAEDQAGVPTCTLGTIAPGDTVDVKVRVKVDRSTRGTIVNTVDVTSDLPDPDPSNNTDTEENLVVLGGGGTGANNGRDAAGQVDGRAAPSTASHDGTTGIWSLDDPDGRTVRFYFGNPGDLPMVGDWDCDGVDTPGLYRQSDGFVYVRNSNSQGIADVRFFFGNPGDVPLAGDWDGDGCDTVSLYRPAEGRVYVIDALGAGDAGLGAASRDFLFGNPGDVPFADDVDGDGIDDIGVYRPSTGMSYTRLSHTTGPADRAFPSAKPDALRGSFFSSG